MTNISFLFKHLDKYKHKLFFITIATILYSAITLLASLVFSFVIDNVIEGREIANPLLAFLSYILGGIDYIRDHLWVVALFLMFLYAIHALLMYYRYNGQAIVAEGLCKGIRDDLYNHLQLLPYAYHVKAKTGDLVQRCTSDVDMVRRFFSGQLEEIVAIVSSAVVAIVILFSLNFKLALIASVSLPIIFLYSYRFFCKIQKQFLASDETEAVMTSNIQESLSGVRVIKAFNREHYEMERFLKVNGDYKEVTSKMINSLGLYWSSSYFICLLGILSVIVFGIFAVRNNEITIGNFLVFVTYQSTILYQIRQLGRILSDFGKLTVSIDRLVEIKKELAEDLEEGDTPDLNGDIVFENVSFGYEEDDFDVLKGINLTIQKGETIAILGPTGSGKSTLIQLLARLYEPKEGRILINGHDIKTIAKGYLRKNIGIVLQEPFLFSKTIIENLKISNPKLDKKAIEKATEIASVHEVIEEFDQGYDTLVGEKGVTLSGGQKQRIAIARTLVAETGILVFDDSLSAVDTQTDANIRKALKQIDANTTMIIITQRILTAKDADRIVVLEEGKITEVGSHDELIRNGGLYARVNTIQNQVKEVV